MGQMLRTPNKDHDRDDITKRMKEYKCIPKKKLKKTKQSQQKGAPWRNGL